MKIVVLRSKKLKKKKWGEYCQSFDTLYADRVIGNLSNRRDFCTACEADCIHCREKYDWRFSENIAAIIWQRVKDGTLGRDLVAVEVEETPGCVVRYTDNDKT